MPVPASLLNREWQRDQLLRAAGRIKTASQQLSDRSAAGPITTNEILAYMAELRDARSVLDSLPNGQRFADYVQDSLADAGELYAGDIRVDVAAMSTALNAVGGWIISRSGQLWAGHSLDAQGQEVVTTFGPAQTAGLRVELAALIATIN